MSQTAVEIKRGHLTKATDFGGGAKEPATAYSLSILDGKLPMTML